MSVYLDDIIIASCSMEEHLIHVELLVESSQMSLRWLLSKSLPSLSLCQGGTDLLGFSQFYRRHVRNMATIL